MYLLPMLMKDGYKVDHRNQYPKGTEFVYSNITPRGSRMECVDKVVFFGLQYFIKEYLIDRFNRDFFDLEKDKVVQMYKDRINSYLGEGSVTFEHIEELHDLGYLPLEIKALPEGTRVPLRTPMLTMVNTDKRFFWLTNFLETLICNVIWGACTSATIADQYKQILLKYAKETSDNIDFVDFQGHDFSMRGMFGLEAALISGSAHLLSFKGTDTIPAIDFLEQYYSASTKKELVGCSVPATEHSVMCLGTKESEYDTYKRLITEVYPKGIVSIVSDTWDYWKVLTEVLPSLKKEIMARDGKLVVRPDSGDPIKIICGDKDSYNQPEVLGTVQLLYDFFGGTINSKGYKELDPHIGVIYGDSITIERAKSICEGLKQKGFASTNIVFGIGSYTYQYNTRDTFGFAMKATHGVVNGKDYDIFKDPKTDSGLKKSAKGYLRVNKDLTLSDQVSKEQEGGELRTVFKNGDLVKSWNLSDVRSKLAEKEEVE